MPQIRHIIAREESSHKFLRIPSSFLACCLLLLLLTACQTQGVDNPKSSPLSDLKETAAAVMPQAVKDALGGTPAATSPPSATTLLRATRALANPALPAPVSPALTPASEPAPQMAQRMLKLINADRQSNKLGDLAWDDFAAQVGQDHANDMATTGYFSHVDAGGRGPDLRYALAGGSEADFENLYSLSLKYSNGRAGTIDDWDHVLAEAEGQLMGSPGHRAQILAPDHTHIGVGVAWNAQTGELRIAQEFLNRYLKMGSVPRQAEVNASFDLTATLLNPATQLLINIAWEPMPAPQSATELANGKAYQSPARVLQAIPVQTANNTLKAKITLPAQAQAGYFHIRWWGKRDGRDVLLADPVVFVP